MTVLFIVWSIIGSTVLFSLLFFGNIPEAIDNEKYGLVTVTCLLCGPLGWLVCIISFCHGLFNLFK